MIKQYIKGKEQYQKDFEVSLNGGVLEIKAGDEESGVMRMQLDVFEANQYAKEGMLTFASFGKQFQVLLRNRDLIDLREMLTHLCERSEDGTRI